MVRKGHDIQKWHSLWGNGLDVWPLNKVSSIGSISKLFGVLSTAGLLIVLRALGARCGGVTVCDTLPKRLLKSAAHIYYVTATEKVSIWW